MIAINANSYTLYIFLRREIYHQHLLLEGSALPRVFFFFFCKFAAQMSTGLLQSSFAPRGFKRAFSASIPSVRIHKSLNSKVVMNALSQDELKKQVT